MEAQSDPPSTAGKHAPSTGDLRPGDDYQLRGDVRDVLQQHGWKLVGKTKENELWRRPGKDDGWSATFNGTVFYCHTSNGQPFAERTGYNKFHAYTLLEHAGDFKAAAKALGEAGYGTRLATQRVFRAMPTTPMGLFCWATAIQKQNDLCSRPRERCPPPRRS